MGHGQRPWHRRAHHAVVEIRAIEPSHTPQAWGKCDQTSWLAETEEQLLCNVHRWREQEPYSQERSQIWQQSMDLISRACGYACQMAMKIIARDFECTHFRSQPRQGRDQYQQNEGYSLRNHITMASDRPRVEAYRRALGGVARWQKVLDVGCGPFCLLSRLALQAGARTVDSVEQSQQAVNYAITTFKDEASGVESDGLLKIGASLVQYNLSGREHGDGNSALRLSVFLRSREPPFDSRLRLFQGFSSEAPLPGGYSLVVHEILGHIASSEGVVGVLSNLRDRGLLTRDCVFVPRRAATLFVPTMKVELSCLERILCLQGNGQHNGLSCLTKYNTDRFPQHAFLSTPALFEDLEFGLDIEKERHHVVQFVTECSGVFDGLHFHMVVDMDGHISINTLLEETSWDTTYVKLLDPGMFLPAGSRIICETWIQLDRPDPTYSITVAVDSETVASFSWSGCTG